MLLASLLRIHLGLQQRPKVGGAGSTGIASRHLLHHIGFVRHILGLDGQVDIAVLAIDIDDLGLDFVAFLQVSANVLEIGRASCRERV